MAQVLTVASRKGGVGKTLFCASLAAVGVSRAFQIGTVDLDSQGNVSAWGLDGETLERVSRATSAAMLEYPVRREWLDLGHELNRDDVTREELLDYVSRACLHPSSRVPGLSVVPLVPHVHCEDAVELMVRELPLDWVLVDTPADPSAPAARSALRQSDWVLAPVQCSTFGMQGVELLIQEIESVGRRDLLDSGRVLVVINGRQKWAVHDAAEEHIRSRWGELVLSETVPQSVRIAEASMAPELLKKNNPIWSAAERIWDRVFSSPAKRKKAA